MSDPRYVEDRCGDQWVEHEKFSLSRVFHVCEFAKGHEGLHYSGTRRRAEHAEGVEMPEPMRWGNDVRLRQEIDLAGVIGVITVEGDATPELLTALRRAFRLRDVP